MPQPTARVEYADWVCCPECGASDACLRPALGGMSICTECKARVVWDLVAVPKELRPNPN